MWDAPWPASRAKRALTLRSWSASAVERASRSSSARSRDVRARIGMADLLDGGQLTADRADCLLLCGNPLKLRPTGRGPEGVISRKGNLRTLRMDCLALR